MDKAEEPKCSCRFNSQTNENKAEKYYGKK